MKNLLQTFRQAEETLPVDLEVSTDPIDESKLPMLVIERERGTAQTDTTNLSVPLNTEAEVFFGFTKDTLWSDIEAVVGAALKAYIGLKPATNVDRVEMGRGASGIRLVKCTITTGSEVVLQDLPDDFSYSY